jgi:agmatinase
MTGRRASAYGPPDYSQTPRFAGLRTFAHCAHTRELDHVDVAVVGVPFDTGATFRPGARFGPEAVRAASMRLRPWNNSLGIDTFAHQSVIDYGDLDVTPGDAARSLQQIDTGLAPLITADALPLVIGGDHTITLGELRAHAAVHGPLGLVLLDAHVDTGEGYLGQPYFHGSPFRRAYEEGLIRPERSLMAGTRGSTSDQDEWQVPQRWGIELIPCEELIGLSASEFGARVEARLGDAPAFVSFDVDVVDPGAAPATGTPEAGGIAPHQALGFVRALRGRDIRGCDIVEVSPQMDGPGGATALLAANLAYEFLGLAALAALRRSTSPEPTSRAVTP